METRLLNEGEEFNITSGENIEEYLFRLGELKRIGIIRATWLDIANKINAQLPQDKVREESSWRKMYKKIYRERTIKPILSHESQSFLEIETQRMALKNERQAISRQVRSLSFASELKRLFVDEIERVTLDPSFNELPKTHIKKTWNHVYVMLSDIHYGMRFHSGNYEYSPEITKRRLSEYADSIIETVKPHGNSCYISLMGDLISGSIHTALRIENQENIVQQVIGVSELISAFIVKLIPYFTDIYINSVPGNHSRIMPNKGDDIRGDRLDDLIYYYNKVKFENVDTVHFEDNIIDSTIGWFEIEGKGYLSVHGDFDPDLQKTLVKIQRAHPNIKVDYVLAGHMHVPEFRMEDVGFIRNGCVCGSGDDYTMKNRLFTAPMQVFMTCSKSGVEAIYPVRLE